MSDYRNARVEIVIDGRPVARVTVPRGDEDWALWSPTLAAMEQRLGILEYQVRVYEQRLGAGDQWSAEDAAAALRHIGQAAEVVGELCAGKRKWTMSIPADPERDSDLVIDRALRSADHALRQAMTHIARLGGGQGE